MVGALLLYWAVACVISKRDRLGRGLKAHTRGLSQKLLTRWAGLVGWWKQVGV